MKALVLEVRDGTAAVLREDGSIIRLRRVCRAGETIELDEPGRRPLPQTWRSAGKGALAAALAVAFIGYGSWTYNTALAASYLSVDVGGSSVEYSLNRQGKVLGVRALNEQSEDLAQALSARQESRESVEETLSNLMQVLHTRGELDEEQSVLFGVTADSQARGEQMRRAVETSVSEQGLTLVVLDAGQSERSSAQKDGLSAGRYALKSEVEQGGEALSQLSDAELSRLLEDFGLAGAEQSAAQPAFTPSPQDAEDEPSPEQVPPEEEPVEENPEEEPVEEEPGEGEPEEEPTEEPEEGAPEEEPEEEQPPEEVPPEEPTQPEPQPPAQPTQPEPQPPAQPTQPEPQPPAQPTQPEPQPPAQPTQPEPQLPAQPTQPEPQQPAQPTQPAHPTQPEPQQPAQPTQPEPQQPAQPTQPEPQQPSQPELLPPETLPPQEPIQPTQPTQPEPQQPSQPEPEPVPNLPQEGQPWDWENMRPL